MSVKEGPFESAEGMSQALPAAALADGAMRAGVTVNSAPAGMAAAFPCQPGLGRALPVRHLGSVDVMLEALSQGDRGDVLVVDDQGRRDRACIGDLVVAEAKGAEIQAVVVWGSHRDQLQLEELGLPIFSLGSTPLGPAASTSEEPATKEAYLGDIRLTRDHWIAFDADGVAVLQGESMVAVLDAARDIASTEQRQREEMDKGNSLRQQLAFNEYLEAKKLDPRLSFREHISSLGGAVEV